MGDDGSVVLAGQTSGDFDGVISAAVEFAAVKLDADGAEVWRWQVRRLRFCGRSLLNCYT